MSSEGLKIRDAITKKIISSELFKNVRNQPTPTVQQNEVPLCCVFLLSETKNADGDANAGYPHFEAEITIGISVTVGGGKDVPAIDLQADEYLTKIETSLLTDETFISPLKNNGLFEAVLRTNSRRFYPDQGDVFLIENRLEMTFLKRVDYPPPMETNNEQPTIKFCRKN